MAKTSHSGISKMEKEINKKRNGGALAIFAKTPGLSPIKTRLAADIGRSKAENFYKLSLKAVEEVALTTKNQSINEKSGKITPYWAIAEKMGLNNPIWRNLDRIWTGNGDLGQRLDNIYKTLLKKHDFVILIGSDSPQLSPELILQAAKNIKFEEKQCVIGPCDDGGFYLFGSSHKIDSEIWTEVEYSQKNTLKNLKNNLKDCKIHNLPNQQDVDNVQDLGKLKQGLLERESDLLDKQKDLLNNLFSQ